MWRTLCELRVKLCGLSVSKSISKTIPNPVGLRQKKLSHPCKLKSPTKKAEVGIPTSANSIQMKLFNDA